MLKMMLPGLLWLAFWIAAMAGVGLAWDAWSDYSDRECQKSRECRERQAEIDRHVVYDEMPDGAGQAYYRD